MIVIKSDADLARMRISCNVAARVRDAVAEKVRPGVSTKELSDYADELIKKAGGVSAFLGYGSGVRGVRSGYPASICVSVNETVVHGIPDKRRIEIGDIVSLDIGVRIEGFIGDTARTVMVGVTDEKIVRLVQVTESALTEGIAQARAGNRLSDISHAVESRVKAGGFSVVRDLTGHGVGRDLHEEPQIPNYGAPGRGAVLKCGMTLAIEPMVNMGGFEVRTLVDGWTVVTRDGLPSAHSEHTVAVTDGAAEIMTI
jgi:methionyl aminopeptidase